MQEQLVVRVTALGYYDGSRRHPGSTLVLSSKSEFSPRWMEWANGEPSEKPAVASVDKGKKKAPTGDQAVI